MEVIKRIRNKTQVFKHKFNVLRYRISSIVSKQIGIDENSQRDKKIIITLTTYPKRFDVVHIAIETLLRQSLKPDIIVLYLAQDELEGNRIPKHITRLQKRGVSVKIVDENLKSYKKLIYAIKEYPDDILITVDDDVLYPSYFVEKLYEKYLRYPNVIIAYRCSVMQKKFDDELMPYLSWENAKNIKGPSFDLFFTGTGGVLYPPESLHKYTTRKELFMNLAPTGDDIWFKAMSLLANTRVVQVFDNCVEFPTINGKSQAEALWRINNDLNQNDVQLKRVFDFFNLYKYVSKAKDE